MKKLNFNTQHFYKFKQDPLIEYLLAIYTEFLIRGEVFLKKESLTSEEFLYELFYILNVWFRFIKIKENTLNELLSDKNLKELLITEELVSNEMTLYDMLLNRIVLPTFNKQLKENMSYLLYNVNYIVPKIKPKKLYEILPWVYNFIHIFSRYYIIKTILPQCLASISIDKSSSFIDPYRNNYSYFIFLQSFIYRKINTFSLDHVSSGVQHIACILNNPKLLRGTNLIKAKNPEQTTLVLELLDLLSSSSTGEIPPEVLRLFLERRNAQLEEVELRYKLRPENFSDSKVSSKKQKAIDDLYNLYTSGTVITNDHIESCIGNISNIKTKTNDKILAVKQFVHLLHIFLNSTSNAWNINKGGLIRTFMEIRASILICQKSDTLIALTKSLSHGVISLRNSLGKHGKHDADFIIENLVSKQQAKIEVMTNPYGSKLMAISDRLGDTIRKLNTYNYIRSDNPQFYAALLHLRKIIPKILRKFLQQLAPGILTFTATLKHLVEEHFQIESNNGIIVPQAHITYKLSPKVILYRIVKGSTYDTTTKKLKRAYRMKIATFTNELDHNKLLTALNANFIQSLDSAVVFWTKYILYFTFRTMIRVNTTHDRYQMALENPIDSWSTQSFLTDIVRLALFMVYAENPLHRLLKENSTDTAAILKENSGIFYGIHNVLFYNFESLFAQHLMFHSNQWSIISISSNKLRPNKRFLLNSLLYMNEAETDTLEHFIQTELKIMSKKDKIKYYKYGLNNTKKTVSKTTPDMVALVETIKLKFIIRYLLELNKTLKYNIFPIYNSSLVSQVRNRINNDNFLLP